MDLIIGARSSSLSRAQVQEVLKALFSKNARLCKERKVLPRLLCLKTVGDIDQTTPLETMEASDFFTQEIDNALLKGQCRIAVHSAKDLPSPLPKGLTCIAITEGVSSLDNLVLKDGQTLACLPKNAIIGTSSQRRVAMVHALRKDLQCMPIRGDIEKRIQMMLDGYYNGVVIAEAALIRLKLTLLNRIPLEGQTPAMQGRLAILARSGDREMEELFGPLDSMSGCNAL